MANLDISDDPVARASSSSATAAAASPSSQIMHRQAWSLYRHCAISARSSPSNCELNTRTRLRGVTADSVQETYMKGKLSRGPCCPSRHFSAGIDRGKAPSVRGILGE
ncbi:unnamed protein product [Symbiodinium natans]|uniref:Uncharacterized protein n=1 Tax=Symbiodinium natans TaxID=878477 RepID=A0A812I6U4_9DINO|nr:unnamed protein product [Symbiodinium natans]